MSTKQANVKLMGSLICEAKQAEGHTRTNPLVGAGIELDGELISTACHTQYGSDHAEISLLDDVDSIPKNSTLFCTLEPCIHHGKTSPCVDRLAQTRLDRVVLSSSDPHPSVAGGGIQALENIGFSIETGVAKKAYLWANRAYFHRVKSGFPWIDVKMAMSADGFIAPLSGDSKWITGETSRDKGHLLRSNVDAVMVGANTLRQDDPRLTDRVTGSDRQPEAIIVSRSPSTLDEDSHLITKRSNSTHIIVPSHVDESTLTELRHRGVQILRSELVGESINWHQTLPRLRQRGIGRILVEGGGQLIGSLLQHSLVNECHLFYSGKIFGSGTPSADLKEPPVEVSHSMVGTVIEHESLGNDVYVRRLLPQPEQAVSKQTLVDGFQQLSTIS